jgi:hypothetical protein
MSEKCCYDNCKFMRYGKDPSNLLYQKFYICVADPIEAIIIREGQLNFIKCNGCKLYSKKD